MIGDRAIFKEVDGYLVGLEEQGRCGQLGDTALAVSAYAIAELPSHTPIWLQQQFKQLQPDKNGKKAKRWVEWVRDLQTNEFVGDAKPKRTSLDTQQIETSYTWGLAQKLGGKKKE